MKSALWAGTIGPALFLLTFTLEGWLRPGYQARSMFVSELALGPRGWIQSINFVIFGVLFLVFTRGVFRKFNSGKASRAGPVLLAIIGVSFLVSGFFTMDPVATPPDRMTWHGTLHGLFGALVFSLSPISCFVFLRRFRVDPQWRWLQRWTVIAGTMIVASVVVMAAGLTKAPAAPNAFNAWNGAFQRAALIPYLLWTFAFAYGLQRSLRTPAAATTGVREYRRLRPPALPSKFGAPQLRPRGNRQRPSAHCFDVMPHGASRNRVG